MGLSNTYAIIFKSRSRKELLQLPNKVIIAIEEKIDALAYNPRPSGCKKLVGTIDNYRIRIGNYRVIYTIADNVCTIFIIKIANRKESYR